MPEYPFRYIAILNPEHRSSAIKDVDWCREEIRGVCSHLVPRATKDEFLAFVAGVWDESQDSYQDFLSLPDA